MHAPDVRSRPAPSQRPAFPPQSRNGPSSTASSFARRCEVFSVCFRRSRGIGGAMHISSAAIKRPLIAACLMMLCGSTEAADDCSVADVLVNSWVRMARNHSSGLPTTKATRRELEFKTNDQVALKGYSYSPPSRRKRNGCEALHPSPAGKRIFGGAVGRDCKWSGARCKAGSVCVRVSRICLRKHRPSNRGGDSKRHRRNHR